MSRQQPNKVSCRLVLINWLLAGLDNPLRLIDANLVKHCAWHDNEGCELLDELHPPHNLARHCERRAQAQYGFLTVHGARSGPVAIRKQCYWACEVPDLALSS